MGLRYLTRPYRPAVTRGYIAPILTGLLHSGFGRHDNHFNVASAARKRAIIIDLDTLHHQVLEVETRLGA